MFATIKSWFTTKAVEPSPIQASPDQLIEAFENILKARFEQAPATEPVKGIKPVATYAGGESVFVVTAQSFGDFCVEVAKEGYDFARWMAIGAWNYLISVPLVMYHVTLNLPGIIKITSVYALEWFTIRSVQTYTTLRHWSVAEGHRAAWVQQQKMRLGVYAKVVTAHGKFKGKVLDTISYVLSDYRVISASVTNNGDVLVFISRDYTEKSKVGFSFPVPYQFVTIDTKVALKDGKFEQAAFLAAVSDILKEYLPEELAELAIHGLDPKHHTAAAVTKRANAVAQPETAPAQEAAQEPVSKETQAEAVRTEAPAAAPLNPKHAEFKEQVASRFGTAEPAIDPLAGISPSGDFVSAKVRTENGKAKLDVRIHPSSTFPVIKDREALGMFDAVTKTMAVKLKNENDPMTGNSIAYHPETDSIHVSGSGMRLSVRRVTRADDQVSMVLTTSDWKKLGELLGYNFKNTTDKYFVKNHTLLSKLIGNGLRLPAIYS